VKSYAQRPRERMEQNFTGIYITILRYLYTSCGFVTKRVNAHPTDVILYHSNLKLLAEKRAQFCKVDTDQQVKVRLFRLS